jgi:hypothetical protein
MILHTSGGTASYEMYVGVTAARRDDPGEMG